LSNPAEVGADPLPVPQGERYTRLRLHARGGLGQVWLGRDELVGRDVAIKEPRNDRPGEAARAALEREAWFLGRLQHPNVVPLYDLVRGPDGRASFYVMPFLGGDGLHDLASRFHRSRPPGPATRLTLLPLLTAFLDVCAALDHAHGRGVWHLDIKGGNVKLGPAGAAVVLDWGLARLAAPAEGEPPTRAGSAGGTPAFMAPEQAESSASRLGPHTDVYGLGALLYLLLTGRPPHPNAAGRDRDELAAALRRPVTPPRVVWPGVPAALEAICLKALAAGPVDRYGSVAELRAEVQHWMADEPVSAYRERLPARLARWGRRHKRAATGVVAVLVTAVLALAVGLVAVDRERQATEAALALERDSFRQALKAGDDYFTAVSDSPLLQAPGQQPLRRELLQHGLKYYQNFLARRGDEPALRAEVAAAWSRVSTIELTVGTIVKAVAAGDKALAMGEELLHADPGNADLRARLADWYVSNALVLRYTSRLTEAQNRSVRAASLAQRLPADHPKRTLLIARALASQSFTLELTGDLPGACAAAERSDALYAQSAADPQFRFQHAYTLVNLGLMRRQLKQLAGAADVLRRARRLFEGLRGEPGRARSSVAGMASCDNALGLIAASAGDVAAERAHYEAAYAARRQLVEQNPSIHSHRAELATTCLNLAVLHRNRGDAGRAAEFAREAAAQAEEVVRRNPADVPKRSLAVRAARLAAGDAEFRGDLAEAARLHARSAEFLAGMDATDDRAVWRSLAGEALIDGGRQLRWGHWRAAVETFRQAFECQRQANRLAQRPDQRASASRQ
jgi:serine/threonine-protein kinase